MVRIKRLTPMLNVADIERSLNFYQSVAGSNRSAHGTPLSSGGGRISGRAIAS
jgi:hypothetical protein